MTFDIEKFVALPSQEELISLKKDELLTIVKYYKLEDIKRSMRKAATYNSLLRYFVEQEIFEDSVLEFLEETEIGSKFNEQLAMRKMEMEEKQNDREMEEKQKDREIEERQREKDREIEERQKNREFELELKKMEVEEKTEK